MAAELGRTVAELRRTISAREYGRWRMFHARKAQREQLAAMTGG